MRAVNKFYIDGEWVKAAREPTLPVHNPCTEGVIGWIPEATVEEVDRAVVAAGRAFERWSLTQREQRAAALERIAKGLESISDEMAWLIAQELGMPIALCREVQVGLPVLTFTATAQLLRSDETEERIGNSLIVREPVGVVACITPWNYPINQLSNKIAGALAAGCTVVAKPSEITPLSGVRLAEVIAQTELPPGVFNMVLGTGPVVGEALASHPGVDMISFTGSVRAGRRVSELGARTLKRVSVELGGKSASLLLEDADLEQAIPDSVGKGYYNSGQTCTAYTRLLVPRSRLKEAEEIAVKAAGAYSLGPPESEGQVLGPLVSNLQRSRVRAYIDGGIREGATLILGGAEAPADRATGYYVQPTVFSEVSPSMTIAQEEIFGPVLVIIPYDSVEEGIDIANNTVYGLAGVVWSADQDKALGVARRMRAGQVEVNGAPWNPLAPVGGYKQSGNGRELGIYGIREFQEIKAIQLPVESS